MEPEVLYRIYTQDKPEYREEIVRTLSAHGLPHFTFVPGEGYGPDQDGKPEHTVVVEIATSPESEPAVIRAVKMLKLRNGEGSVKLVRVGVAGALVTDPTFRVSGTQDGRVGVVVRDPDGDVPKMTKEELSAAIRAQMRRGHLSRNYGHPFQALNRRRTFKSLGTRSSMRFSGVSTRSILSTQLWAR